MKHTLSSRIAFLAMLALLASPLSALAQEEQTLDIVVETRPARDGYEIRGEAGVSGDAGMKGEIRVINARELKANGGPIEIRAVVGEGRGEAGSVRVMKVDADRAVMVRSEMAPTVVGRITAVSGTTLTVEGKAFGTTSKAMATSTYSVNAASAKIVNGVPEHKDRKATAIASTTAAARTVADLKVGDHIVVRGTLTGTTVVATEIIAGKADEKGNVLVRFEEKMERATGTPAFLRKVGGFFKNLFGKREAKFEVRVSATSTASTTVQQ